MYRPLSIFLLIAAAALAACTEPAPPTLSLYSAVQRGDLDQVKRHLYWKTDVNQPDVDGDYPLHVAARDGRVRIARQLVEHGADPALRTRAGKTALEVALRSGKTQVALMLIEHGAALDAQRMLADLARAGVSDRDSFELLLRQGASLGGLTADGETPLHLAIAHGHLASAARLIALGADVNQTSQAGETPLALALRQERERGDELSDIIALLKREGAAARAGAPTTPHTSRNRE